MNTFNLYYESRTQLGCFVNENHDFLFQKDNSLLIQVFTGRFEQDYLRTVVSDIEAVLPQAVIIGTTTSGEISNGKVTGQKTAVSISVFQKSRIKLIRIEQGALKGYDVGQSLARNLDHEKTRLLILFTAGDALSPSQLLMGIESICPKLNVAGGVAGNDFERKKGCVFCSGGFLTEGGTVGAALESSHLKIWQDCHLSWTPIGKEMTITRSDENRVYTIDNIPAYQIYKKYLGLTDPSTIVNYVFPLFATEDGIDTARHPIKVHSDDSISFCANVAEGERVRFSYGNVAIILKSIDKLMAKIGPHWAESIFIYSCSLRRGFLQDSSEIETMPLQSLAPTAGFFTYGEFFHSNNMNHLLHATMTTLALSESVQSRKAGPDASKPVVWTPPPRINLENSHIEMLKALTCLINNVTRELTERTVQLEKADREIKYASSHDPETGLYNRNRYEQALEDENFTSRRPFCVIVCEVDGLQLANDTIGHRVGDLIVKATAEILRSLSDEGTLTARIRTDEFSMLLPECPLQKAEDLCEKIRDAVSRYNEENLSWMPLSISVGFSCKEKASLNAKLILREADFNMYQEKLKNTEATHKNLLRTVMKSQQERGIMTQEQSSRLQELIALFARQIGYPEEKIPDLQCFACFHDIGKVAISDQILQKPASLMPKESREMRRHSEIGYRIAQASASLVPYADWILKRHEWWNGKGYPLGLSKEDIPLECRMLSIVDCYDVMTHDQPYRKATSKEAAKEELRRYAGIQFDPALVESFLLLQITGPN